MDRTSPSSDDLVCPGCGMPRPVLERFCPDCALPLVHAGQAEAEVSPRQDRARKVKPQLAEGELVKVAGARNQAEAEFLQGLLLEEGVPSTLRRARGFDVPDFLAAGPRDVMVPMSGAGVAREVLLQAELDPLVPGPVAAVPAARVLGWLLVAFAVVALVAWAGTELLG